ncbi:MAG TPA: hypothetical protein VF516_04340 [Kofleriaceae bacterium]
MKKSKKKSKIKAPPARKLVLRRESIAQLTRAQLDHVAGADQVEDGCSYRPQSCAQSNALDVSCVTV